MTRRRRILIVIAALALVVVGIVAGGTLWLANTQAGARFALARVRGIVGDRLELRQMSGTLAGPLVLEGLAWRDPAAGVDFSAQRIEVDLRLRALLHATVRVSSASLQGLQLTLREATKARAPDSNEPFSLQPPVDIVIDRLDLAAARVVNAGGELVNVRTAALQGSWTRAGVALQRLDLLAAQGEVHFSANVSGSDTYTGRGNGRFRWHAADRDIAGTLTVDAKDALAALDLSLTAPLAAHLRATLRQDKALPWTFTLDVPAFDPRKAVLPDSSLDQLMANLQGSGSAQRGTVMGRIGIDAETLQIDTLAFEHRGDELDLDGRLRFGAGTVQARGTVKLAATPVSAKFAASWQDIVIPADLAGQVLHTKGALTFDGSATAYQANGNVTLGPPGRLADIAIALDGTAERLRVAKLEISQAAGKLAAKGEVTLKPALGWDFTAQASRFDPGAFAAAWQGRIDFDMQTRGVMREGAPAGSLVISHLRGTLRARPISGDADLRLGAQRSLQGVLQLRSGASQVRIEGRSGSETDASVMLDVASLGDWLPDAAGLLRGHIDAKGQWPALHVVADIDAKALRYAASSAGALRIEATIDNPTDPSGTLRVSGTELAAAGFDFSALTAHAAGNMAAHSLQLDVRGDPLSTQLQMQGSLRKPQNRWTGTVQQLVLDTKNVAHLALQAPVTLRVDDAAASLSRACFADVDKRLCLEGTRQADGALHATYELHRIPLAMANAFLPPSASLVLSGDIEGSGEVTRSAAGRLDGRAQVRSASGQIARGLAEDGEQAQVLLRYADLALDADLAGESARLSVGAKLDDSGALKGDISATGLGTTQTPLRGDVTASLPSLAVIEVFASQLANVQGRASVHATIDGTLDNPKLAGSLDVNDFAADVLQVGLKLREGSASVKPGAGGTFDLAGSIKSGTGQVDFNGNATAEGLVKATMRGKDFLAADIPGAKVTVSPDLTVERTTDRTTLGGRVTLTSADINLQRLPRGNRAAAASDDVVIVDDAADMIRRSQSSPLYASITIELGEQVKLSGYGLDATVTGQLDVRERPGEPTTGSGEIRVAGTYKAYGQDLTIRQGQLLYAATPLDNPQLAITAVRVVDTVTAGLRVTGSAQSPQLAVFSDPTMGQSNALAFLVTGKALDEIGQGNGDSDALQSAARSLGTAAGGLLAKKIGSRLGVDEVGIKESSALGGSALTVGQYLSPRLYLSYGVGLFTPGEVITLRYKLTNELALEAENAAQNSRAGLRYKIEK